MSQQSAQCFTCSENTALYMCGGCTKAFYCSPECQSVHWSNYEHALSCSKLQAIGASIGDENEDRKQDENEQDGDSEDDKADFPNQVSLEVSGDIISRIDAYGVFNAFGQIDDRSQNRCNRRPTSSEFLDMPDVREFSIFFELLRDTKFYRRYKTGIADFKEPFEAELSVFAPENKAMVTFLDGMKVLVREKQLIGGEATIDYGQTMKKLKADPRYAKLLVILVGHFIPGIRPVSSQLLEKPPDVRGFNPRFPRLGITPGFRTTGKLRQRKNPIEVVDEARRNVFFQRVIAGKDDQGKQLPGIVTEFATVAAVKKGERLLKEAKSGTLSEADKRDGIDIGLFVKFSGQPTVSPIRISKEHSYRGQNTYIHRISSVLVDPAVLDTQEEYTKEQLEI